MASSCTTRARKRKVNATTVKTEQSTTKKKRCSDKTMPKKTRAVLVKSVNSIEPSLLVDEVRHNIEEQFSDGKLNGFVETLLKGDEPMLEIAKHHRDSFVSLYDECKPTKSCFMQFQLRWHSWCSAFLLEEKYTLEAINLKENDNGYSSLVSIRNTWLEFCKSCNTPVPTSNPVMIAVSSSLYAYLLNHVSAFQESVAEKSLTEHTEAFSGASDGDDIYYRFGGAALCVMLKNRYKEIKTCPSLVRNVLSVEIFMLQAMKIKDKSSIPDYLRYRDKGFMYFPDNSLVPFLRNFDSILKEIVNEEGLRKHGDNLIKACIKRVCFSYTVTQYIHKPILFVFCNLQYFTIFFLSFRLHMRESKMAKISKMSSSVHCGYFY